MRFHTTILQSGPTATGIVVPQEVVDGLGAGKRAKVNVTIKGYTYRSSIAPMNGVFMVGVSAETRAAAGVKGGDEVDVDIEVDTAPREVVVPADFAEALAKDDVAKKFFDGLSYSNQRRYVLQIEDAKTPETRARRIEKSVIALHDGKA